MLRRAPDGVAAWSPRSDDMNAHREKLPLARWHIALRIIGVILLTVCAVMVVLGTTVLASRLEGPRFLVYWTWCMLLVIAAIIMALWDLLLVRRISKRTHRELFRQQFMSADLSDKSRNSPDQE
jgi:high-affinity Fe2+/Pb2+ permease